MTKLLSSSVVVIGLVTAALQLLVAFGVDITPDQHTAIEVFVGALLTVAGLYFHPSVPIGPTDKTG